MTVIRAESRRIVKWALHGRTFTQPEAMEALGIKQSALAHVMRRLVALNAFDMVSPKRGKVAAVYIVTERGEQLANEQPKAKNGYVKKAHKKTMFSFASSVFNLGAMNG